MAKTYGRGPRDALFGIPDRRGNNPHGTNEGAEAEARRLNYGRYETVGEVDRALDERAAKFQAYAARQAALGAIQPAQPSSGLGFFGALALFAAGAIALHLVTQKNAEDGDEDDELEPGPRPDRKALPAAPPVVVVQSPAVAAPVVNPAPVIDVVAEPVRRRRRAKRSAVVPAVVTTTTFSTSDD